MKNRFFIIILFATVIFSGCKTDDSVGLSIQPPQDAIKVVVDTFWLSSADYIYDSISAQCSDSLSMLLGEFYSEKYGSTKAELIVQIAPPLNFKFPDENLYHPAPDSVVMMMFYSQWFGSSLEPLEIAVYELDKATPDKYAYYPTTLNVSDFINVNDNLLLGSKITTPIDYNLPDSIKNSQPAGTLRNVRYKFKDEWAQNFFDILKGGYEKIDDFTNKFKGFYITTTYGQSTMLYLYRIDMRLYYNYTYQKNGKDTVVPTHIDFPASKEVRQLNKITHINTQNVINQRDSVNYLKTGGGIYPKIKLPLGSIQNRINDSIGNKMLSLNSAVLSIEATEIDSSALKIPIPPIVMLLPVGDAKEFFESNSLDVIKNNKAVIAYYNSTKKEYTFDLAYTLMNLLKSKQEEAEFMLVPVDIDGYSIKPQKYIGAATIRSAKNDYSPMRIELVYSGF